METSRLSKPSVRTGCTPGGDMHNSQLCSKRAIATGLDGGVTAWLPTHAQQAHASVEAAGHKSHLRTERVGSGDVQVSPAPDQHLAQPPMPDRDACSALPSCPAWRKGGQPCLHRRATVPHLQVWLVAVPGQSSQPARTSAPCAPPAPPRGCTASAGPGRRACWGPACSPQPAGVSRAAGDARAVSQHACASAERAC